MSPHIVDSESQIMENIAWRLCWIRDRLSVVEVEELNDQPPKVSAIE